MIGSNDDIHVKYEFADGQFYLRKLTQIIEIKAKIIIIEMLDDFLNVYSNLASIFCHLKF